MAASSFLRRGAPDPIKQIAYFYQFYFSPDVNVTNPFPPKPELLREIKDDKQVFAYYGESLKGADIKDFIDSTHLMRANILKALLSHTNNLSFGIYDGEKVSDLTNEGYPLCLDYNTTSLFDSSVYALNRYDRQINRFILIVQSSRVGCYFLILFECPNLAVDYMCRITLFDPCQVFQTSLKSPPDVISIALPEILNCGGPILTKDDDTQLLNNFLFFTAIPTYGLGLARQWLVAKQHPKRKIHFPIPKVTGLTRDKSKSAKEEENFTTWPNQERLSYSFCQICPDPAKYPKIICDYRYPSLAMPKWASGDYCVFLALQLARTQLKQGHIPRGAVKLEISNRGIPNAESLRIFLANMLIHPYRTILYDDSTPMDPSKWEWLKNPEVVKTSSSDRNSRGMCLKWCDLINKEISKTMPNSVCFNWSYTDPQTIQKSLDKINPKDPDCIFGGIMSASSIVRHIGHAISFMCYPYKEKIIYIFDSSGAALRGTAIKHYIMDGYGTYYYSFFTERGYTFQPNESIRTLQKGPTCTIWACWMVYYNFIIIPPAMRKEKGPNILSAEPLFCPMEFGIDIKEWAYFLFHSLKENKIPRRNFVQFMINKANKIHLQEQYPAYPELWETETPEEKKEEEDVKPPEKRAREGDDDDDDDSTSED